MEKGILVVIGGKHAKPHTYQDIIGRIAKVTLEARGGYYIVIEDGGHKLSRWVDKRDLLPYFGSNRSATPLLDNNY